MAKRDYPMLHPGLGEYLKLGAMDAADVIAERQLIFVKPDGSEIASSVQFGRPYVSDKYGVCCDLEIPGVAKRRFSAGIDGVQAILTAMSLAATILDVRVSEGWRLLWPDTREEATVKEMFGSLVS
jgi:hypothetical protein